MELLSREIGARVGHDTASLAGGRNGQFILAEDEEISGTIASNALMNAGHAVGWPKDRKEVLAAMARRPLNLAILDCNMPGMSGVLVFREMRRRATCARCRF
jgi:DNA-binding response OmpR family regulator